MSRVDPRNGLLLETGYTSSGPERHLLYRLLHHPRRVPYPFTPRRSVPVPLSVLVVRPVVLTCFVQIDHSSSDWRSVVIGDPEPHEKTVYPYYYLGSRPSTTFLTRSSRTVLLSESTLDILITPSFSKNFFGRLGSSCVREISPLRVPSCSGRTVVCCPLIHLPSRSVVSHWGLG